MFVRIQVQNTYALARKNGHREIVSLFKVEKNILKLIAHERTNKCAG